jgi:hypothetical protein
VLTSADGILRIGLLSGVVGCGSCPVREFSNSSQRAEISKLTVKTHDVCTHHSHISTRETVIKRAFPDFHGISLG